MGNSTALPLPAKRSMHVVCFAFSILLLPFWVVFLVSFACAKLDPCADNPAIFLVLLVPLTLPWLLWMLWLWRTPESRKPSSWA